MIITSNAVIDAVLQISIAFIGGILIFPHIKHKYVVIFITAILAELLIDGFHLIDKAITHNIFFLLEGPLILFLIGYMFEKETKIQRFSLVLLVMFSFFLFMDTAIEGDVLMLQYPISTQTFIWNSEMSVNLGAITLNSQAIAMTLWLLIVGACNIFEKVLWYKHHPRFTFSFIHPVVSLSLLIPPRTRN